MNIFNKNSVQSFKSASDNILSIFTKTVNDLNNVNFKINDNIAIKNIKITKLAEENVALLDIRTSNDKMINKLNEILK